MHYNIENEYSKLTKFVEKINKFYVREGKFAQSYFESRGLNENARNFFGIGYAPKTQKTLEFIRLNNLSENYLAESGIFIKKDDGIFDLFSNRITFALNDIQGNFVGFSARIFTPQQEQADLSKYVNSTSSPIFQKSLLLYNLYNAIPYIKQQGYAILVEGNMDVISLWLNGIKNVVAPCGTSLTEEQIKLLKLFTKNVVICYDNDIGGNASLPKVTALFINEKINAYPLNLMGAKDPDEFIQKYTVAPILSALSSLQLA